jgi:CubicO group peptidase (beta-lactamase class C family)
MGKPLPERARGSSTPPMIGPEAAGLDPYWPTSEWKKLDPEMLGLDAAKLQMAIDYKSGSSSTQAVFVVRHGYVAAEKYSGGFSATSRHESYSMAKSFSSALVGIAIGEGKIKNVDEKLCMYYPDDWDCSDTSDPRSRITIKHAMNIETGLQWSEDWRSTATGANDAVSLDLLSTVLSRKAVEEPGTRMRYSTGDPALLTGVIQGATGKTALAYAKEKLFTPIGTTGIQWNSDLSGHTTTYAGLQATAAEYAKFGYLYLNKGKWDGKEVVPESWVELTTHGDDPCTDWYRYLWHQNPPVRLGTQDPSCPSLFCQPTEFANLPPDAFFAEGVNGQFVFIVPSADMVIVRLANDGPGSEHWDSFAAGFLGLMLDAVK